MVHPAQLFLSSKLSLPRIPRSSNMSSDNLDTNVNYGMLSDALDIGDAAEGSFFLNAISDEVT